MQSSSVCWLPSALLLGWCCGLEPRTATIIIGYLYAVTGFAAVFIYYMFRPLLEREYHNQIRLDDVGAAVALIQILASLSLIYGGYKGIPRFFKPWLAYTVVSYVTILTEVNAFFLRGLEISNGQAVLIVVVELACTGLVCYFLAVVGNHYATLTLGEPKKILSKQIMYSCI